VAKTIVRGITLPPDEAMLVTAQKAVRDRPVVKAREARGVVPRIVVAAVMVRVTVKVRTKVRTKVTVRVRKVTVGQRPVGANHRPDDRTAHLAGGTLADNAQREKIATSITLPYVRIGRKATVLLARGVYSFTIMVVKPRLTPAQKRRDNPKLSRNQRARQVPPSC
jgi:hypothetical protein